MRLCKVEGCTRKYLAKGYCEAHYARDRKGTPLDTPIQVQVYGRVGCKVDGCTRKHSAKGYCRTHYKRYIKGTPLDTPIKGTKEYFENKPWKKNPDGYLEKKNKD